MARLRLLAPSLALALALPLPGCGGEEDPAATGASATTPAPSTAGAPDPTAEPSGPNAAGGGPKPDRPPTGPAETPQDDPRLTALERAAAGTARDYVRAIDDRDGGEVCALLAPGALEEFEFPREKNGCAQSLTASIGYEDPRGLPVWESSQLVDVLTIELSADDTAKVVGTVVTGFADRQEPSVEDDVIYLVRDGDGWLVAKPSSTLYRAVGVADVPRTVLSPP